MYIAKYFIVIIVSYLIGNISVARVLSRLLKKDITKQGSGNPGTMNMLRTFGFGYGILTLFLDAVKGALGAMLGFFLFGGSYINDMAIVGLYIGGLSVILGHIFPVFYKFKGGKGVASLLGVFCVANPMWVAICFVLAFVYLYVFDYGAIASFIFITILTFIEARTHAGNLPVLIILFVMFCLVWFMHRKNINRLLIGNENKTNLRKSIKKLTTKKQRKDFKKAKKELKKEEKEKEIG